MPSPIGHALAGVAAGLLATPRVPTPGPGTERWQRVLLALLLGAAACSPDLDFLFGTHSARSHSLGAVLIVAAVAWVVCRDRRRALAAGLAYATHPVLDWLGHDTAPPLGVMLLWPVSQEYFQAPVSVLPPVLREYRAPHFWTATLRMVLIELALFGPPAALAWWRYARTLAPAGRAGVSR